MVAHDRVDILVKKAGQTDGMTFASVQSPESFEQLLDFNMAAPFQLARRVAREMTWTGGKVILTVASVLALAAYHLGVPGAPRELDGAGLFLASETSSYMTEPVLVVAGGYLAL